jgi:MFS family permease
VGGVLTAAFGYVLWLADNSWESWAFKTVAQEFIFRAALTAVAMVAVVVIAEALWPAVRVPGGRLYGSIGRDRRVAAAIQGAVVGATVGMLVVVVDTENTSSYLTIDTAVVMGLCGAAAFVIAEVLLERLSRRRADQSTPV